MLNFKVLKFSQKATVLARIINNTQGYLPSIKAYISSPDEIS